MAIPVGIGVQELRILRRSERNGDVADAAGSLCTDDRQAETVMHGAQAFNRQK